MLASQQLFIWRTQSAQLVTCCKIVTKLHSRLLTFGKCCLHCSANKRSSGVCCVVVPTSLSALSVRRVEGRKKVQESM